MSGRAIRCPAAIKRKSRSIWLTLTYAGLVTGSGAALIALVYLYMSRLQLAVPEEQKIGRAHV